MLPTNKSPDQLQDFFSPTKALLGLFVNLAGCFSLKQSDVNPPSNLNPLDASLHRSDF
jgi:hypothetical protein